MTSFTIKPCKEFEQSGLTVNLIRGEYRMLFDSGKPVFVGFDVHCSAGITVCCKIHTWQCQMNAVMTISIRFSQFS